MTSSPTGASSVRGPLRLWPGILAVSLQWPLRFAVPFFVPEALLFGVAAGLVGALAVVIWWVFFSRAPWLERLGAPVLMVATMAATQPLLHVSIAQAGQGMLFPIYAIPVLSLAFVVWAVTTRNLAGGARWLTMVAAMFLACGVWTLVRTGGITGDASSQLAWRWTETPEERLLARAGDELPGATPVPIAVGSEAAWPGFRGADRNSTISGVRIDTDWTASPPAELWRRPLGPGWSSFAVHGDLFYTQEQRGDDEIVACYRLSSGDPVWMHRDTARFWESNGGAGPRGTPTLHGGRVYALGATGILNALDASDGAVVWSRDVSADADRAVPIWGFSSSPLVFDDLVIVAAAGRLVAYDLDSGDPRWLGPNGGGYSSPQLFTLGGIAQLVFMSSAGATAVAPSDGTVLWEHPWRGAPIVQPAMTADGDLLISTGGDAGGAGTRRLAVSHGSDGWAAQERWTSIRLKPYFNDFVVHEGHAYGFDGSILAAITTATGERAWKGGRYGHGQLVLLADQDLLLVISEDGELVLVGATPARFTELARFPAIQGKTWNHPVLVDDVLLVRNGEEMAAFRLALAGDRSAPD